MFTTGKTRSIRARVAHGGVGEKSRSLAGCFREAITARAPFGNALSTAAG
jgi:hypothetical protein